MNILLWIFKAVGIVLTAVLVVGVVAVLFSLEHLWNLYDREE